MKTLGFLIALFLLIPGLQAQEKSLVEKLGYQKSDVLLIINNDDSGMSYASNLGTIGGMTEGLITSSTIMFNCPWSLDIVNFAKANPDKHFGVHLVLTSEWKNYKWSSVASSNTVSSLLDPNGYLWRSVEEVYQHGKAEHAYLEGKAQIEKALHYGLPITHIDSHMGTFQLKAEYIEQYVRLAKEFNLPLRMASQSTLAKYGMPNLRKACEAQGLVFVDYLIYEELKDYKDDVEKFWLQVISNLKPGVTELYLHASKETDDLKVFTGSWKKRMMELEVFTKSEKIRQLLKEKNIHLISYKPLLDLQRKAKP